MEKEIDFQFKGMESLDFDERNLVFVILHKYHRKLTRLLEDFSTFNFFIKTYNIEGKRKKFSVVLKVIGKSGMFESDSHGWEIGKVMKEVVEKMDSEIRHKMHLDGHNNWQGKKQFANPLEFY